MEPLQRLAQMKSFLALILLAFCLPLTLSAQQNLEDVVYLKNGSVIRGIIVEQVPGKSVKIQTRDGSIFAYQMADIARMTKEPRVEVLPMKNTAVVINALGILQFGPIIAYQKSLAPDLYLDTHIRLASLGVLYHLVAGGFEDQVSMNSMALGVGVKRFVPNPDTPHRLYFGSSIEYAWGGTSGDLNTQWEWVGTNSQLNLLAGFGYRWRYSSGLFLNLGLLAGFSKGLTDSWWYISNKDNVFENTPGNLAVAMLEFSFGWEK